MCIKRGSLLCFCQYVSVSELRRIKRIAFKMETTARLNKTKSTATKKKLKIKKYQCNCQCVWMFLSNSKIRNQIRPNSSGEASKKTRTSSSFDKTEVLKKKTHITLIPKIGCTIPYLKTLFTSLSSSKVVLMDENQIMNAVNVAAKAKADLDEGNKWKGTVEIAENLKLKLYKKGLVLCYKK
jgi:hypothetical protein